MPESPDSFEQQAETVLQTQADDSNWRVTERAFDSRTERGLLVLENGLLAVRFTTDADGRVLVDFAERANPEEWIDSSTVTEFFSDGDAGMHSSTLAEAHRRAMHFLERRGQALAELLRPEKLSQTRQVLRGIGERSFERFAGQTIESLTRKRSD